MKESKTLDWGTMSVSTAFLSCFSMSCAYGELIQNHPSKEYTQPLILELNPQTMIYTHSTSPVSPTSLHVNTSAMKSFERSNLIEKLKGFKNYFDVSLSKNWRVGVDVMKVGPLSNESTNFLKLDKSVSSTESRNGRSKKGLGLSVHYSLK